MRTVLLKSEIYQPRTLPGVRANWRYSLLVTTLCVVGVRLFLTIYLAGVAIYLPRPELRERYATTEVEFFDSGWEGLLLGVWQREDALWYQKIATVGYSTRDMTPQLFPLYPIVMKAVSLTTGLHPIAAGILVSEASLLAAFFLLHRLLLPCYGIGVANRTLVYLALFPSAFFLHGPFSESLMLFLAVLAFFLVSRNRWLAAVAVGYMAGLARPQGMLLGAPLALQHCFVKLPGERTTSPGCLWRTLPRTLALVGAPVAGFATFRWLVVTPWGNPGFQGGAGPMAYQFLGVPGIDLVYAIQRILSGAAQHVDYFDLVLAVGFLLLALASFWKLGIGYATYALLFVLAPLSRSSPLFPLMSFPRFVLLLFPCFLLLALWGSRRWLHLGIILLWTLFLCYWAGAFCYGAFVA